MMTEKLKGVWKHYGTSILVIACASIIVGALAFCWWLLGMTSVAGCNALSRIDIVHCLSPNELGDLLAGIAGSLAFLVVVMALGMQSRELALARREYALLVDETKAMATALHADAAQAKEQTELLRDQRRAVEKRELELDLSSAIFDLNQLLSRFSETIWSDKKVSEVKASGQSEEAVLPLKLGRQELHLATRRVKHAMEVYLISPYVDTNFLGMQREAFSGAWVRANALQSVLRGKIPETFPPKKDYVDDEFAVVSKAIGERLGVLNTETIYSSAT